MTGQGPERSERDLDLIDLPAILPDQNHLVFLRLGCSLAATVGLRVQELGPLFLHLLLLQLQGLAARHFTRKLQIAGDHLLPS